MQAENVGHKKWKRIITGNKILADVMNPLRNYIENQIKKIDLSHFPNRPQQKIDLSIGDPNNSPQFRTHASNLQILASNVGRVDGYTDFRGLQQARKAVAIKFKAPAYSIDQNNVFMTAGGSMAMWATIRLLANPGDNFLFPSPGFPLSLVIAKSIGITPKFYHLQPDRNWEADLSEMESLIDERTKFIYVNDPSNPLGSCWSEEHKKDIIALARKTNVPLMADQIYQGVTYEKPVGTFAELSTQEVTVFKCSGLTKRWFGPGWRMGWLIVYGQKNKIQNYLRGLKGIFNILLMPNTIMQASVKGIIENSENQKHLQSRLQIMKNSQQLFRKQLDGQSYCLVGSAAGALYLTIVLNLQKFKQGEIPNAKQFCKKFFAQENVMIFPGDFFAGEIPFVRITISCANSFIEEFIVRFKRFSHKYLA